MLTSVRERFWPSVRPALDVTHSFREGYASDLKTYMDDRFLRSPRLLIVETFVKCNARCDFCPYPTSPRIGERMPTELVQKIFDEVSQAELPLENFVLCKLSEPLLNNRYFDLLEYGLKTLPHADYWHITNGTTLTAKNIERLISYTRLDVMNVSLNSHDPEDYHRVMGLNFDQTIKNLKHLHREHERLNLKFRVHLSRVKDGTPRDTEYLEWCRSTFPRFTPAVYPRFDWLGKIKDGVDSAPAPLGCRQWYQLAFLANGKEALCCLDDDGKFGRGDIRHEHALDIYSHPTRMNLRLTKSRDAHPGCQGCRAWV
jgi:pyruvate-formate lyase-activating enzyme